MSALPEVNAAGERATIQAMPTSRVAAGRSALLMPRTCELMTTVNCVTHPRDQADIGMQLDRSADVDGLRLGDDPVGIVDVAAGKVFEQVVAIEAAATLA